MQTRSLRCRAAIREACRLRERGVTALNAGTRLAVLPQLARTAGTGSVHSNARRGDTGLFRALRPRALRSAQLQRCCQSI